ncbi:MAG: hypothetical protein A2057_11620 [Ignavibacteria bacterium GWA2_35_9]|nr:MAG: hypothetical protein A2057_11620 [Ignavibacteria bacterium GWA2_35_9]OGU48232.1 MAG: hypothetical protein A2000_11265 [Ignavibacteria bacterium GWB2_36_8]OGU49424.1 MAG: hypothetical protein A2080_16915 [Ignavibacteria bacterium GWC2_36_12]OGU99633.1 MAG: hypothetical protein A2330_05770 [Ignavibacteria bacterium RIFOXYB2_FULL_36_7]
MWGNMTKRLIDLVLSPIIIVLSIPFIVVILFLVIISTGQFPVIFQKRKITLEKKSVQIIKIRTIRNRIEIPFSSFKEVERISNNVFIKEEYEMYVPLFCRWLRKSGLDEILQVINVLKGEMSLIGPRPLLEADLEIMQRSDEEYYNRRTKINSKPGITGMWQVYGERREGTANLIELEEFYEKEKSLLLDMRITLRTIFVLLTASHSDSILKSKEPRGISVKLMFGIE